MARTKSTTTEAKSCFKEKQDLELQSILQELALRETFQEKDVPKFIDRLHKLYYPNKTVKTRHNYAAVNTVVHLESTNCDILINNLSLITQSYKPSDGMDISLDLGKILDHVNLEKARIDSLLSLKEGIGTEVEKLKDESKSAIELVEKSKIDVVAIIGIFSAMLIGVIGSFIFSSSVLSNMKEVPAIRLYSVILCVAFLFFNTLWLLTEFICHISSKNANTTWIVGIIVNAIFVTSSWILVANYDMLK